MAYSLRLPAGSLWSAARSNYAVFSIPPAKSSVAAVSCQSRQFSQGPQRSMKGMPQNISIKQPAQPSMKTRGRGLAKSELPTDIGLLPGTFIRPVWSDLPSIFQQPRERLHMEWLWLKTGFQNFFSLVAYCKWINKGIPLRLKERRQIALGLHRQMYTVFAKGDVSTLRKICCTGLADSLSSRISVRPKNEKVTWSLDKYIKSPATFLTGARVVSDRAQQIPELPNSGVRQVVVRITSRQSTGKVTVSPAAQGKAVSETSSPLKQQDCTEYIVVQQIRWTGEDTEWRVWGHASPTTVEDLDTPMFATGLTLAERMEALKDSMSGKQ